MPGSNVDTVRPPLRPSLHLLIRISPVGPSTRPTAQRQCLPRRESKIRLDFWILTKRLFIRRFPNPVPWGTCVPQWALIDNTGSVRFPVCTLAKAQLIRCPFYRPWASGMPPRHSLLVVTIEPSSPCCLHLSHPVSFILDSPEVLAGSAIGPGSVSTSVAQATATVSPASSKSSSSNTAAIAGGIAGGVVGLALIGGILFYFLRRRQPPQAPSAAFVVDGATASQSVSHMVQVSSLQSPDEATMSSSYVPGTLVSPMKLFVRYLFLQYRASRF
jgi:hypothetical protein